MTDTPNNLLPCPFCGGRAELSETMTDERSGYNSVYTIQCGNCRATISGRSKEGKGGWKNDPLLIGRKETIALWNTRKALTPPMSDAVEAAFKEGFADAWEEFTRDTFGTFDDEQHRNRCWRNSKAFAAFAALASTEGPTI